MLFPWICSKIILENRPGNGKNIWKHLQKVYTAKRATISTARQSNENWAARAQQASDLLNVHFPFRYLFSLCFSQLIQAPWSFFRKAWMAICCRSWSFFLEFWGEESEFLRTLMRKLLFNLISMSFYVIKKLLVFIRISYR